MIQIFDITTPLDGADGEALSASLTAQMDKLKVLYPALRDAAVTATQDHLTMRLRVSGRTRWHTSYAARAIGTNMLRRLKLVAAAGTMVLVATAPGAVSLTKGQGRNVTAVS